MLACFDSLFKACACFDWLLNIPLVSPFGVALHYCPPLLTEGLSFSFDPPILLLMGLMTAVLFRISYCWLLGELILTGTAVFLIFLALLFAFFTMLCSNLSIGYPIMLALLLLKPFTELWVVSLFTGEKTSSMSLLWVCRKLILFWSRVVACLKAPSSWAGSVGKGLFNWVA